MKTDLLSAMVAGFSCLRESLLTVEIPFGEIKKISAAQQYNGNIGRMLWQSIGGNGVNEAQQQYEYTYDPISRLKTATYSTGKAGIVAGAFNVGGNDNGGIAYDANGNIENLFRYQQKSSESQRYLIDNLTYNYPKGNQLTKVDDGATGVHKDEGFKHGANTVDEYTYDANGNKVTDKNKAITWIQYNHLNPPEEVQFANGNSVKYLSGLAYQRFDALLGWHTSGPTFR